MKNNQIILDAYLRGYKKPIYRIYSSTDIGTKAHYYNVKGVSIFPDFKPVFPSGNLNLRIGQSINEKNGLPFIIQVDDTNFDPSQYKLQVKWSGDKLFRVYELITLNSLTQEPGSTNFYYTEKYAGFVVFQQLSSYRNEVDSDIKISYFSNEVFYVCRLIHTQTNNASFWSDLMTFTKSFRSSEITQGYVYPNKQSLITDLDTDGLWSDETYFY
jgi:hypothetical protein